MRNNFLQISIFLLAVFALSACGKKKWNKTVSCNVHYEVSKPAINIANNPLTVEIVELQLNDFILTGDRIQSAPISISQPKNGPVDFLNNSQGDQIDIPIGTYTSMNLKTSLVSNQNNSLTIKGSYQITTNLSYRIIVALNIEQEYDIAVKDSDGSSTLLFDKKSTKTMNVLLDLEALFSGIDASVWNNANITLQNGSLTLEIDDTHNQNLKTAIENQIGESLLVCFE